MTKNTIKTHKRSAFSYIHLADKDLEVKEIKKGTGEILSDVRINKKDWRMERATMETIQEYEYCFRWNL